MKTKQEIQKEIKKLEKDRKELKNGLYTNEDYMNIIYKRQVLYEKIKSLKEVLNE